MYKVTQYTNFLKKNIRMKKKEIYTALGLMSGTSMDGVDTSIISSKDGDKTFEPLIDRYFEYDKGLREKLTNLRDIINNLEDLTVYCDKIKLINKEITLFHAKIIDLIIKSNPKLNIDIIGFHGQTIFHDSKEMISLQLGDGKLLSQLTKKKVVFNFRNNDLKNNGQGAPLTPVFHQLIIEKNSNKNQPIIVLNIGGISNATCSLLENVNENLKLDKNLYLRAADIGPGNCLIDKWIRKNSKYKYDNNGQIARTGKVDRLIYNQALDFCLTDNTNNYEKLKSLDIKDFDISFARGLSLEDGAATITHLTAELICEGMKQFILKNYKKNIQFKFDPIILICGGGRKNEYLIEILKDKIKIGSIDLIDGFGFDGDFVESQAFGYFAIRTYYGLPISYPKTTGCKSPTLCGDIVKNF